MRHNSNIKVFDTFKSNTPGIQCFVPNNRELYKKGKPCHGFGRIKYGEGSIYTGEIYFDGKEYHKFGFGRQDFTFSTIGAVDPAINEKIYCFVGNFDHRKTNRIYGNGVMYYRDLNGNPSRFVKGFFYGLDRIDNYKGEFDYSTLEEGYSDELESEYAKKFSLIQSEIDDLANVTEYDTLFFGDSYFELWHDSHFSGKTFKETYDTTKYLDIGVGGTKYSDWIKLLDQITYFPKFKNIVINLGFNDVHYCRKNTPAKVFRDLVEVLAKVRKIFGNPNVYILSICHAPGCTALYDKEIRYNQILFKNAKKLGVTIIDNCSAVDARYKEVNVYDADGIHLNPEGYKVMVAEIAKHLK